MKMVCGYVWVVLTVARNAERTRKQRDKKCLEGQTFLLANHFVSRNAAIPVVLCQARHRPFFLLSTIPSLEPWSVACLCFYELVSFDPLLNGAAFDLY